MHWFLLLVFQHIYRSPLLLSVYKGLKYLVHITTQTSEIYRLCNVNTGGEKLASPSIALLYRLDQSIFYSKQLVAEKRALQEPDCDLVAVTTTVSAKKCLSPAATEILAIGLGRIHQTNCVLYGVERQIQTKYDRNNTEHEDKLKMLWNKMKPDEPLKSRHSKQWVDIGFQGTDPATDFRGMGMGGLDDLLYFVTNYPQHAHSVLQHASHPVSWYPYAIVGINLTKFAYHLLERKQLQMFLFEYTSYHEFYCYLFYHFNQFWISHEPALTVMDFEQTLDQYKKRIERDLFRKVVKPLSSI